MAGTRKGGVKASQTNMEKYGRDFYRIIGARGGRNGHTGGFASNPELAKQAGAKGGSASKRGKGKSKVFNILGRNKNTGEELYIDIIATCKTNAIAEARKADVIAPKIMGVKDL